MKINTSRFGEIVADEQDIIFFREGILGFESLQKYILVDPGDETLILWLQSVESEDIAFPILEPRVFRRDYSVKLPASELEQLELASVNEGRIFSILTIPEDIRQMTANLKAPLIFNTKKQKGRQAILSQNEYEIRCPMFKELRSHILSIRAAAGASITDSPSGAPASGKEEAPKESAEGARLARLTEPEMEA